MSYCDKCGQTLGMDGKCRHCKKEYAVVFSIVMLTACFLLAVAMWPLKVKAQTPVVTQPYLVNSTNVSSTVTATNTFQSIFAAPTGNQKRSACTIVNYGTNTMWVFFGAIADATKGKSIQLTTNSPVVYCNVGGVTLQDQVSITGTMGDAFFAAQQ